MWSRGVKIFSLSIPHPVAIVAAMMAARKWYVYLTGHRDYGARKQPAATIWVSAFAEERLHSEIKMRVTRFESALSISLRTVGEAKYHVQSTSTATSYCVVSASRKVKGHTCFQLIRPQKGEPT